MDSTEYTWFGIEQGLVPAFALSQQFMNEHPAPARPEFARAPGLPTTSFRDRAATALR